MNNIRYFREKKGYTQPELAKLVGLTPGMISKIENCKSDLKSKNWKKLAQVLDCTVDELMGRMERSDKYGRD